MPIRYVHPEALAMIADDLQGDDLVHTDHTMRDVSVDLHLIEQAVSEIDGEPVELGEEFRAVMAPIINGPVQNANPDFARLEREMEAQQEALDGLNVTNTEYQTVMNPYMVGTTTANTIINVASSAATTVNATATFVCGQGGLAPDSDYFLCGLYSCNDITPDVDTWVRFTRFNMNDWLDNYDWQNQRGRQEGQKHGRSLMLCGRELRGHYLDWRTNAPAEQRAAILALSAYGLSSQFKEFLWGASDKAVIGLLQEPAERPLEEAVLNPNYIGQTILNEERLALWVQDVADFFAMFRADFEEANRSNLLAAIQSQISGPNPNANVGYIYNAATNTVNLAVNEYKTYRQQKRITKAAIKQVRQAVKRSSKLFERMVGREELRHFLAGKPVRIDGELFSYEVSRTQSVIGHTANPRGGHIPYNLTLMDGDKRLAKMCVYFDRTPLLDQIVGLAMFIKSGEEEQLIKTANMFDRCADYDDHPLLRRLGKTRHRGDALREAVNRDIENATNELRIVVDPEFEAVFGVSNRQFKEEVVPWRERMRLPILQVLANMTDVPLSLIEKIAGADKNGDEMAFWRQLPGETADDFLEHALA